MATFTCDRCGYSKSAPDKWLNRQAICPKCKNRAIVTEDAIVLSDTTSFDETATFAYKGDYLGMPLRLFLRRHNDVTGDEFSIVPSTSVPLSRFQQHGFEAWMDGCERLVQYCATGSRLTIVGFPLDYGVFTFFDDHLDTISLAVANPSTATWARLLPAMYSALTDETELTTVCDIHVVTWKRPRGTLSVVFITDEPSIDVRYVNLDSLDAFNKLRTSKTGSDDL